MRHHPMAFCAKHGFFPATAISLENSSIILQNMGTVCPTCGGSAEILPGRYDAAGDRLNFLMDGSISPQTLAALRRLAERLQRNEITPEQAKTEAEKIAPKAGRLFDVADWSDGAKATLYASIIGAIALVAAAKLSVSGGSNPPPIAIEQTVESAMDRQKERLRNSTSLPYIPIPTPRPK